MPFRRPRKHGTAISLFVLICVSLGKGGEGCTQPHSQSGILLGIQGVDDVEVARWGGTHHDDGEERERRGRLTLIQQKGIRKSARGRKYDARDEEC